MRNYRFPVFMTGFFCLFLILPAQGRESRTIFELLYDNNIREIELHVNIDSILLNRKNDERVPGKVIFTLPGQGKSQWNVEINVRGRYRRMNCEFPPLKINFKKQALSAAGLETHNNLKLVTHCFEDEQGEDRVLREYLIYRMYQQLTDVSIRAHLVRVSYIDQTGEKRMERYAMFLEDEEELAARLDSELCEDCYNQSADRFDTAMVSRLGLFQYMIGNIDWSVKALRNLLLLKPKNGGSYLLVPYDFDFSGVVNPPYARVPAALGIKSIRQRVYLGFPYPAQEYHRAFTYMKSRQEVVIQQLKTCREVNGLTRTDIRRYIESFYKMMENDAPAYEDLLANSRQF